MTLKRTGIWHAENGKCLHQLRAPGPYEGMNISGVTGVTDAQRVALRALGAVAARPGNAAPNRN